MRMIGLLCLLISTAIAQTPQAAPAIKASLEGKTIGNGKLTQDNWKTDWGSYDRDYLRMQHLELKVSTWGKGEVSAEVEVIWFGRGLEKNGPRVVLKREKVPVALKGGTFPKSMLFHSGAVSGNVTNYAALGERDGSGEKIEGWYARIWINGKTVHDVASQTFLADVARDPTKLGALQDYTPKKDDGK